MSIGSVEKAPEAAPPEIVRGSVWLPGAARRAAPLALGLLALVLALELLKRGAGGLLPLMRGLDVSGVAGGVGFGWLMACAVLSGSPVAAIALSLLAAHALSPEEAFGMVGGSRLGASFVVLVMGFLDDLRHGRKEGKSAYIGVAALLVTGIVYVPAMAVGCVALEQGAFAGLRIEGRELTSLISRVLDPVAGTAAAHLPRLAVFASGVACLLGSFRLLDAVLPDLAGREPVASAGRVSYRPWFMFAAGLAVTALTLSVAVSLSLLVPLASKGYVRRENVFPYILGANITTFVDTLLVGALVGHPDAVRVVALLMAAVTVLSLPLVFAVPYAFEAFVDRLARRATASRAALAAFTVALLAIPALLLAL